jgi:tetratricopeptide (TPR) repeat protein
LFEQKGDAMWKLRTALLALVAVAAFAAGARAQAWRGTGRLAGRVVDESGKPVPDADVKLFLVDEHEGTTVKTNKNGEWVAAGVGAGQWQIDFSKEGYVTKQMTVSLGPGDRKPPFDTTMKAAPRDPNDIIHDQLVKAAGLLKDHKYAEARQIYEDLRQQYPKITQFLPLIARTYVEEKNYPKAIETLRDAVSKDPDNPELKMLLANTLSQNGQDAESNQILQSIDPTKITDPATMLNIGIGLLNEKKPDDALKYFDQTVTRFPAYPDGYYYRAITNLQLGNNDKAKPDLQKFLQLAPDSPDAATARKMLETLKQQ